MYIADKWHDYELIDTGSGEKLERWGNVVLCRPDPQAIWPAAARHTWQSADARYMRASTGGGSWDFRRRLPERWQIGYDSADIGRPLRFYVHPTNFKHTGLFPEQAVNWDWMGGISRAAGRQISVLNLFGYTGGATCALAASGAAVCHVDAAKGMVAWAKENAALSGLSEAPVRYIVDDAVKFVERELRRGRRYDGILMDPPSYGRGPDGQVWKLEEKLYPLVEKCAGLLSDNAEFFLINAYTTGLAASVLKNILTKTVVSVRGGIARADEVGLPVTHGGICLPCGASGRWQRA